ncbi:hypothetical protein BpHYR1_046586 [Brachionus plicatilis]|uniref:Uncharacterized protein n=1 Tax=Brachionus plicatilis TaxID=10195 RepID=A0A3M7RTW3_BRAPC|nr:hypothetical protein BpHYR1_046586 [Brachionus plicatilis]
MIVFSTEHNRLCYDYVQQIFTDFQPEQKKHTHEIKFPKSGDVLLYWTNSAEKYNDWSRDGFKWRNQGAKKALVPTSSDGPLIYKSYHHLKMPDMSINKNVLKINTDNYTLLGQKQTR